MLCDCVTSVTVVCNATGLRSVSEREKKGAISSSGISLPLEVVWAARTRGRDTLHHLSKYRAC